MKAIPVVLVATLLTSCVAGASFGSPTGLRRGSHVSTPPPPPPSSSRRGPSYGPGEDQHWFSGDDYLVAPERQRAERVQRVRVAKMLEPPADGTKGEARFLVATGGSLWTGNFHRSRVALPEDLVVNALAFCHSTSTYRNTTAGPRDKQDSRNEEWFFGRITDASDTYKGRVSIGSRSCPIAAVRVPIR